MSRTIYRGRPPGAVDVVQITPDGEAHWSLPARLDVVNHSPTGFSWGYSGSGPSQLALAILMHHTGDRTRSLRLYHRFKERVIAQIPSDARWELSADEVERVLEQLEAQAVAS